MRAFGYTLDPTVIDRQAQDFFLFGQCWALAEVLTDEHGWPVVVEGDSWDNEDWWCHALVEHPSGNLVDIRGFTPQNDAPYYDQNRSFVDMATDCWIGQDHYVGFSYYRRRSLAIARAFVPVLLDTYELAC